MTPPATPPTRSADSPPKVVLVVDDDETMRQLILATLRCSPYRVLIASDGEEALAVARAHRPDLVLLDVIMPKRDGLAVCRQLKADPRTAGIEIVMLTAQAQPEDRAAAQAAGADGYLTKPFRPFDLLQRLRDRLDP
ncbi:MAG TPA: response regulator [Chloroflexota bacterium]|jgi:CheY-like chemotaxis protein